MQNQINHKIFLLLFFLSLLFSSTAQNQQTFALLNLLDELEQRHDISFNYVVEDLSPLELPKPNQINNLDAVFDFIFKHTQIEISKVNNNNYAAVWQEYSACFQLKNSLNLTNLAAVAIYNQQQLIGKTNSVGKFFLHDSSVKELTFKFTDFFSENISVETTSTTNCSTIYLYPEQELDEVIVQTYLTQGIDLNNDLSIEFTPSEFGVLPGLINADVLHSLQYVPGIVNSNESVAEINVRGGTNDQNLLLWNGARLYQGSHFFGMISSLNPFAANHIQVSKNGSSAFHSEGVSSVISIETKAGDITENSNVIHSNFLGTGVVTSQKMSEHSKLRISARRSFTDVWESPTYKRMRNKVFQNTEIQNLQDQNSQAVRVNENFYFADASASFHHQINDKNEMNVNILGIQNELEFNEILVNSGEEERNNLGQNNFLGSLNFNRKWNSKHQTQAEINVSFYELSAENKSVFTEQNLLQNNQIMDLGFQLKHQMEWQTQKVLNFGYHFHELSVSNENLVTSPSVRVFERNVIGIHALIVENNYQSMNQDFDFRLGLRVNYYSGLNEFQFSPRLNLSWQLLPKLRIHVLAEQKLQSLTQVIDQQQDFFGLEKRRWKLANGEDFPLLKSQQAEIGLQWKYLGWRLQSSLFHKSVNGITSQSQGFQNQLEFLRLQGDYKISGIEFFIQKHIQDFRFWLNYAFSENDYEFTGFKPSIFPNNFEVIHSSAFGLSYENKALKVALGGRYIAGHPTTSINSDNPILNPETNPSINYKAPNFANLEDYYQANASVSYTFKWQKFQLESGMSFLNLFDTAIETDRFYRFSESQTEVERIETQNLGLTINAFLTVFF
jgi:hypothetical protein